MFAAPCEVLFTSTFWFLKQPPLFPSNSAPIKVMTRHVHAPPQHGLVLTFFNFFSKFLFFFCCIVSWSSENFLFTNEPSVWSRYFFVFFWTENPRRKEGCWRDRESYCTFLWLELGIQLESEDSFDRDVHDRRGCLLTVTVLMVH